MKEFLILRTRITVLKFFKCWVKSLKIRKTQLNGLRTYKKEDNTVLGEYFTG